MLTATALLVHRSVRRPPSVGRRVAYLLAVAITVAVFGLQHALEPVAVLVPFILLFLSVFLASWVGGRGPGFVAIALAAALADYELLPPAHGWSLSARDFLLVGLFGAVSSIVNLLCDSLRRALDESREHLNELRAVLDAVPAMVLVAHDASGRRVEVNRPGCPLLELEPGTTLPMDADGPSAAWRLVRKGGEDASGRLPPLAAAAGVALSDCETDVVFADGRVRHLLGNAVPLHDLHGAPRGSVSAFLDVTELQRARLALADEARRKDEFLALLSHELRNPLAAIRHAVQLQGRAPPRSDAVQRARAILDRQSLHLARMVDDLPDVARISQGRVRLSRRPLDLDLLVTQTAQDYQARFDEAGVALRVVHGEGVWVRGDPTRLAQIVGNLLHNAVKFTPRGGSVTATVARDAAGRACLAVADTGAGVDPEFLPHVFDVFAQADTGLARTAGGLGLGLALVRTMAQMHGGAAEVHSDGRGLGARFVVRLPCVEPEPEPAPSATAAPAGEAAQPRRILLVEDNADTAEALRAVLEVEGHRVERAASGPEGLAAMRRFRPDLVLCDIGLPGMDGYSVARAVRGDPELRTTRLVALTGYAGADDAVLAREAGFHGHPGKPANLEALLALLPAGADARVSRPAP